MSSSAQEVVRPDIRPAGTGPLGDADDPSDAVVLEARGEDVRGAVAPRIGDEHDRTVVALPAIVGVVSGRDRESGRESGAGLDGIDRRTASRT